MSTFKSAPAARDLTRVTFRGRSVQLSGVHLCTVSSDRCSVEVIAALRDCLQCFDMIA
jgi:hypothetical protein